VAHRDVAYLLLWTGSSTGSELPGIAAVRLVAFDPKRSIGSQLCCAAQHRPLNNVQTCVLILAPQALLASADLEVIDVLRTGSQEMEKIDIFIFTRLA
jgi:hypothetical protein